jgi:hypothetical protein
MNTNVKIRHHAWFLLILNFVLYRNIIQPVKLILTKVDKIVWYYYMDRDMITGRGQIHAPQGIITV